MTKSVILAVLAAFVALVVILLILGGPYLETPLLGGLPIGNGLVALGLCALAGTSVVFSGHGSTLRAASYVSLVGAALWLPVSVALAGNLQLNFGGGRGAVWLALSVAVFAGTCSTLLWALGAAVLARIRRAGAA